VKPAVKQSSFIGFLLVVFLTLALLGTQSSCRKSNSILSDSKAAPSFSTDTLSFDTLFTSIGSTTGSFKIYNPYSQTLRISDIYLQSGASSVFYINVDGVSASTFKDIDIPANDSIYVFVGVKPNVNNQNTPLVIDENIVFICNNNKRQVTVEAWGQDAYFHVYEEIQTSTWKNDKPHVLLRSCLVDTNATLTIEAGAKIYCHPRAYLLVSGAIQAIGTKQDSILFRGDRLERFYDELPGQWGGIVFLRNAASGSTFEHCIIKNATSAFILGSTYAPNANVSLQLSNFYFNSAPSVTINKCKIYNCQENAIFGFNSIANVNNTLIYNCSKECVNIAFGGQYHFKHCTIANYTSNTIDHSSPCLVIGNYMVFNGTGALAQVDATFDNSMVIGNIFNKADKYNNNYEVYIDHALGFNAGAPFNYSFTNCLLQIEPTLIDATKLNNCAVNLDWSGLFYNRTADNYHLVSTSAARNAGDATIGLVDDLDDVTRSGNPDIGCYEY
jgi:hypothetical protein